MGDFLSVPNAELAKPFGRLTPRDAAAVRATCVRALAFAAPFRGSLAFALTRCHLGVGQLSLSSWTKMWKSCLAEHRRAGFPNDTFARTFDVSTHDATFDVSTHDQLFGPKGCKQIPAKAATPLVHWSWLRAQAGPEIDCDNVFVQVVDRYGNPCQGEPQWTTDEVIAALALRAHYIDRQGSWNPSLLKVASLLVLDDSRLALLWSIWTFNMSRTTWSMGYEPNNMEHGCSVIVGPTLSGLAHAAAVAFGQPVWNIREGRLEWTESQPDLLDAALMPHYYCQTPEVAEPSDEMISRFSIMIRNIAQALPQYPSMPGRAHLVREQRLSSVLDQTLTSTLSPGDMAILKGLVQRPELNGRSAQIRAPVGNRWSANVEGLQFPVSLKPENLITSVVDAGDRVEGVEGVRSETQADDMSCDFEEDQLHDETVIQPVYRGLPTEEPAAQIHPDEASALESQLWASRIEQLAANSATDTTQPNGLLLLSFARCPQEFGHALRQSGLAHSLTQRGVDIQPEWADGALVLASGIGLEDIVEHRGTWNVAVHEADEPRVFEALRHLPYNIRPRLKVDGRFLVPGECSLFQASESSASASVGSSDQQDIVVERTFIHVPPEPMASVSDPPPTV